MSSRTEQRRARLQAEYGFDFPPDFYRFWEFANRVAPLAPLEALTETLGIALVGPFEVLSGRFDGRVTRHSLLLHWRFHDDPPEFFTVLAAGEDGLHWGYYLDDPDRGSEGCVASYFAHEACELDVEGDDLFEAVRLQLEFLVGGGEQEQEFGPGQLSESEREQLVVLRRRIMEYATADRPEIGEAYTEKYAGAAERNERVVADTLDNVGIVVPAERYRPLSKSGRQLRRLYRKEKELMELIAEARRALEEGYPGTALKLGKDLWAMGGRRRNALAVELLEAAYRALGRESLARVLLTHTANRSLPSVDILDDEERA